jgi:hypothetical protein
MSGDIMSRDIFEERHFVGDIFEERHFVGDIMSCDIFSRCYDALPNFIDIGYLNRIVVL